eukprot:TRINITY_DN583_c0_g1_i1.p1 TRINITY_DN583_c0_g1~~TRINITY_DN583_c0_g1_i1.p1  ORF type:complete len:369 (-),score=91.36 TRINITY_DN583_c0_g1_i1:34-1140(-)
MAKSLACICAVLIASALLVAAAPQPEMRLIQWSEDPASREWVTIDQLEKRIAELHEKKGVGLGFMDVTDSLDVKPNGLTVDAVPTQPTKQAVVNPLLAKVSATNLKNTVTKLSSYYNRYYTTTTGAESANWLFNEFNNIAINSRRSDVSVAQFKHSYVQSSVIATIKGRSSEVVVIGAHEDSIAGIGGNNNAPGADDDATGTASVLEAFRILVESGYVPSRTIEFMAYAAEEVGLRGSQDIARNYQNTGKVIAGVLQMEMSGYVGATPAIVVIDDSYTTRSVTNFIRSLIPVYTTIPAKTETCGYGCSDHASWTSAGYIGGCIAEAGPNGNVNPNMHTARDTTANLNFDVVAEFTKLAVAFAVEVADF